MKNICSAWLISIMIGMTSLSASAQSNGTGALIKQGVDLHNQGRYAEAVEKFNEVLKTDPENDYANYEMAYSLYANKKPKDAIPHLEKSIKSAKPSLSVASYSLLASIYDEDNQPKKAIETYKEAIKIDPNHPQIFYNLGISYFRDQQFAEAENSAIEAIKHDPKNASSQRLYALVTFHQNKRANALLGFCSFILLEPAGPRAAEAYANIQHIIQGGVLKDNKGNTAITVSTKDDHETAALNLGISLSVQSAHQKKLEGNNLLEYELKTIFTLAGELAEKKTETSFFDRFFADYFYNLAKSDNMPAFAHIVASTANKEESEKWANENKDKIGAMSAWVQKTERKF